MPSKVFIPNKGSHDYSEAERYGELIFVSDGIQNRFSVDQMCRTWKDFLSTSTKKDYLLVTSLTILNCIGCAVFVAKHGVLNLLLFKSGKYMARSINLREEGE